MSTGVKPFIFLVCILSIVIYWPSEAIAAKIFNPADMELLHEQWSLAPVIFVQDIVVFLFVMVEFGVRKYSRFEETYRRAKENEEILSPFLNNILGGGKK